MKVKVCNKCGNTEPINTKFCTKCGNDLTEATVMEIVDKKSKKNNKIIVFTVIGVFILFILMYVAFFALAYYAYKEELSEYQYIDSWGGHIIVYNNDDEIVKNYEINLYIDLDDTFKMEYYDFLDNSNSIVISGTHSRIDDDIVKLRFKDGTTVKAYIDDDTLCFNDDDCEDYLIRGDIDTQNKTIIRDNIDPNTNKPNRDYYENDNDDIYDWTYDTKMHEYVLTIIAKSDNANALNYYRELEKLEREYDDTIYEFEVFWFDIDKLRTLYKDRLLNTYTLPEYEDGQDDFYTFITYDGEVLDHLNGYNSEEQLKNFVDKHIKNNLV